MKAGTTSVFIVLFFLVSLELDTDLMKEWMNEQWIYLYSYVICWLYIFVIVVLLGKKMMF